MHVTLTPTSLLIPGLSYWFSWADKQYGNRFSGASSPLGGCGHGSSPACSPSLPRRSPVVASDFVVRPVSSRPGQVEDRLTETRASLHRLVMARPDQSLAHRAVIADAWPDPPPDHGRRITTAGFA